MQAPAKLNLFFEVLSLRADGFHEIVSLAAPISLYDTLTIETQADDETLRLVIETEIEGSFPDVPCDERNLILKALHKLRQRTGVSSGANVRCVKRIPSQAGLGGGSSDAAAALRLGNEIWNTGLSFEQLTEIAAELGSDVPLFLCDGPVVCRGRGEMLQPCTMPLPPLHFLIFKPPEGLSTAAVYAECDHHRNTDPRELEPVLQAWQDGDLSRFASLLFNRLEDASQKLWPRFREIRELLLELNPLTARMSGSGTAFFALFSDATAAAKARETLREKQRRMNFPGEIHLARTHGTG